jgi:hypothetical protein
VPNLVTTDHLCNRRSPLVHEPAEGQNNEANQINETNAETIVHLTAHRTSHRDRPHCSFNRNCFRQSSLLINSQIVWRLFGKT